MMDVWGAERGPASSGWLVSFGDLLTLLLAFFVASVAGAGAHSEGDQRDSAETVVVSTGIDVAKNARGALSVRDSDTVITVQDITWNGVLSDERILEVQNRLASLEKDAAPISLVLCTAPFEGEVGSIARVGTNLIEQMRQGGVRSTNIAVAVKGAGCRTPTTAVEIAWAAVSPQSLKGLETKHG